MEDISQIERKVREYEGKIQKLKKLERELDSLNTEGFESEVRSIKSKIKDPRKIEAVEGDFSELKRKITKKEQERIKTDKKYREAKEQIKYAESAIEKAEEFGCDTLESEAEELLNKATSEFERGNYEEAISDASRTEKIAKEIKGESKPEIKVDLSKKEFRVGVWEKVLLKVLNKGNANAKNVKIEFERAEVEGLELIKSLGVGEKKDLTVDFKSKDTGSVPLKIDIRFEDFEGKRYEEPKTVHINVGEVKEKPGIPIEDEFRRLAVGAALDKIITPAEYRLLLEEAKRLKISRERADVIIQGITNEYGATIGEVETRPSEIEIKRDYEILPNNDLRFGIRIVNNTSYAILDVETKLGYPKTLFSLKGNIVQMLANIHPNGKRTATYILTPLGCIHNEKIDATIFYKDHTGKKQTVEMRPKEVHCVCPFLREKAMREGEFAELANICERIQEGLSFSGISVNEITEFVKEACAHRLYVINEHEVDAAKIVYFAGESIGEKAYYLLTAVIQPFENFTQVALRAYSDKPYGLHGFLNEIAISIRHLVGSVQSAKEIGIIESKQVINIIDSVVQRTSFGGIGEGTGATSVTIEGSVVQRSQIGSGRRCPNCGKEVQADEKFCPHCGKQLK